jgi:hypothetical protein
MSYKLKSQIVLVHGNQRRFAKAVGVCESVVSLVISGRYNLTDSEKELWAQHLHCSPEKVFGEEVTA